MENYTLNKYDFKNYLLKELPDTKQVDLIFWKKTIPMPVDLIYGIFDKSGELLKKYIDHIGAAFLYSYIHRTLGKNWTKAIEEQPTKANKTTKDDLYDLIDNYINQSGIKGMTKEMADLLLLNNYEISSIRIFDALCHEGRKYKRIYIPVALRSIINKYDNQLLNHIALSNWDMFSNVVADELKVYRMGFADAFSGIFNKLLDFILMFSALGRKGAINASDYRIVRVQDRTDRDLRAVYGPILDGCVWEPRYVNGQCSFILSDSHPYCDYIRQQGTIAEKFLIEFAFYLSEIENETIRDSDKKVIEILRQELSRKLRVKAEDMVTETK
jgi:hypothetical protein